MKPLPYWYVPLNGMLFGGFNFAINLWKGQPSDRAFGEALLQGLIFGILMHLWQKYRSSKYQN